MNRSTTFPAAHLRTLVKTLLLLTVIGIGDFARGASGRFFLPVFIVDGAVSDMGDTDGYAKNPAKFKAGTERCPSIAILVDGQNNCCTNYGPGRGA